MVDTAEATYIADTTGTVTLLNGVATGTDFTNRIGRKVCWKSILIQGYISPETVAQGPTLCRVMLVYDSQPNGALPAITDVLLTSSATAPMQLNNRDRFKILWDKRIVLGLVSNVATTSVADRTVAEVRKYKKINLDTIYDGTTNAIADVQSGSIFMLTVGATANGGLLAVTIRCRFVDA